MNKELLIGSLDFSKPITIYGAGISGLLCAYYLKKSGHQFTLYEKGKIGGKISTNKDKDGIIETAANAIYADENIFELLEDLGLKPLRSKEKLKKLIARKSIKAFPLSFFEIIKVLFKLFFKKTPEVKKATTVGDFFRPLLGDILITEVLSPALSGIYAQSANDLHFLSIFKAPSKKLSYYKYFKELKQTKATSVSFKGGMQEFVDALYNYSKEHIVLKEGPTLNENSIIATDAHSAAEILETNDQYSHLSKLVREVSYSNLSSITIFSRKRLEILKDAFGIVIAHNKGTQTLGILANSEIFTSRTFSTDLYSYTFISKNPTSIENDLKLLNIELPIYKTFSTNWSRAIPVYNFKRYQAMSSLQENLKGIVLFGNYTNSISIREINKLAKSQFS